MTQTRSVSDIVNLPSPAVDAREMVDGVLDRLQHTTVERLTWRRSHAKRSTTWEAVDPRIGTYTVLATSGGCRVHFRKFGAPKRVREHVASSIRVDVAILAAEEDHLRREMARRHDESHGPTCPLEAG